MPRRRSLAWGLVVATAGCVAPAPPTLEDVASMTPAAHGSSTVYYRPAETKAAVADQLAADVEDVRQKVRALIGVEPPRAELLVYPAPTGAVRAEVAQHTGADVRDGRVRFVHPLPADGDALARDELLGTTGHELAESTILSHVVVLDAHTRWMHDGIAELAEHEVTRQRAPAALRTLLERARRFVAEARSAGVEWVDLTRWRQLPGWVIRSWRVVNDGGDNVGLADIPAGLARIAAAKAALARSALPADEARRASLDELAGILERAKVRAERPWRPGEARTDDPRSRDYIFYVASFALWLEAERERPGALPAFVEAFAAHEAAGDPVITSDEVEADLTRALGHPFPRLERVTLAHVDEVLAAEAARLEGIR